MRNALKNLAVVVTLTLTLNVTALAVPTSGILQPQKDSLTKVQIEREKVESKIEQLDNEIGMNMTKAEENKTKISMTEKAIKIAVVDIVEVEGRAESEEELFNSRIRTMYMNGFDGYAQMILSAETLGDFVSRVENIKTIINFDKEVMNEFKATKIKLNEKQQSLEKTKEVLLSLQAENKEKLKKIILAKDSQKKLINQLNGKENIVLAETSNDYVPLNAIGDVSPSRGTANISQNAVVSYASAFLGTPYLWAGTSPSTGFDCSGFTQYVYRHFGISIGRSTGDQIRSGVGVSKDELQPGDLVFFGSASNPHHTGIYIGDNKYIHSPHTGDVIKISSMTRRDYIRGRRVR
ncbi:MAG: NlpC/P60 family protein [Clostridiaceae bacterium]|nr:NlpC/P60 family protein [Clostridiaceae bacterium]